MSEFIFAEAVKELPTHEADKLTLKVANGETYISSLALSELGLKLYYGEPKTIVAKTFAVPSTRSRRMCSPRSSSSRVA